MNCQSCNTRVDYLFLTNCAQCGEQVEPAGVSQVHPVLPDVQVENRLSWKRRLVNFVYVFVSSFAGMVSGAVTLYFGFALLCILVLNNLPQDPHPGVSCARGTYHAVLSILTGAFLGTVGGTAFAVKKPLFKAPSH